MDVIPRLLFGADKRFLVLRMSDDLLVEIASVPL